MTDTATDFPSAELASLLGVKNAGGGDAQPSIMLDSALELAGSGLNVFPCRRRLGRALVGDWYKAATVNKDVIVTWWYTWPTADIAVVPDKSSRFALAAFADEGGLESLAELERHRGPIEGAINQFEDVWGNRVFLFIGQAYTSHHKVGRGLHVLGTGHYFFAPPSLASHVIY